MSAKPNIFSLLDQSKKRSDVRLNMGDYHLTIVYQQDDDSFKLVLFWSGGDRDNYKIVNQNEVYYETDILKKFKLKLENIFVGLEDYIDTSSSPTIKPARINSFQCTSSNESTRCTGIGYEKVTCCDGKERWRCKKHRDRIYKKNDDQLTLNVVDQLTNYGF